jgi:hypothetical protein
LSVYSWFLFSLHKSDPFFADHNRLSSLVLVNLKRYYSDVVMAAYH